MAYAQRLRDSEQMPDVLAVEKAFISKLLDLNEQI